MADEPSYELVEIPTDDGVRLVGATEEPLTEADQQKARDIMRAAGRDEGRTGRRLRSH
jgi:hypothetical protein